MSAEPVARVQSIAYKSANDKWKNCDNYQRRKGELVEIKKLDLYSMKLDIWVLRPTNVPGKVALFSGYVNMPLYIGDIIYNGGSIISAIEFFIGGRAGINQQMVVSINSERTIRSYRYTEKAYELMTTIYDITIGLIPLMGRKLPERPLEIQTNGGVMGIKG